MVTAGDASCCRQGFAWHANEICAVCITTSASVVSLPVLCVSVYVLCVVRSLHLSMLFTGNQTSHPIARPPPQHPTQKGTDTAVIVVHCMPDLHDQLCAFFCRFSVPFYNCYCVRL